jgi:hypothetical protein
VDGGSESCKGFKPTHRMADTHNDSRVSEMAQIAKEFREKCPGHLKPRFRLFRVQLFKVSGPDQRVDLRSNRKLPVEYLFRDGSTTIHNERRGAFGAS